MKVLMYGWEFPPFISGGLGVACHAMVQELAKKNIKVTMVLPFAVDNYVSQKNLNIISYEKCFEQNFDKYKNLSSLSANLSYQNQKDLFLHPYISFPDKESVVGIDNVMEHIQNVMNRIKSLFDTSSIDEISNLLSPLTFLFKNKLSGKYSPNLLAEVYQYAIMAGSLAKTIEHDVIHAHDWLTVLAGVEAKKRSGKSLIFHVHALEPDRSGENVDPRIFAIEKYGMIKADKIIAVSQYTKNVIINKYGIPEEKISVVHNGMYLNQELEIDDFSNKKHKLVLFLGRLTHQKGPFFFLEVAQKILETRKDVHFAIAGSGYLLQEMIEKVAAMRIGKYVHFLGFIDNKKIEKIFSLADVYVMPSVSEPFGLSCLEALSFGVPAVISKQSGVSEVLHHVSKVDYWDIDEMTNKIIALLDFVVLRKEILANTSQDLERLTWDKTAENIIKIYNTIYSDSIGTF